MGVFRQARAETGPAGYEVLGLAFVEDFDGTHFLLRGEPIDWRLPLNSAKLLQRSDHSNSILRPRSTSPAFSAIGGSEWSFARIYHERCSLCSVGYRLRGKSLALDAAHIIPVEEHGIIADVRNGLLLCRNHHSLFDGFAWTMDEDLRVVLTKDEDFRRSALANHVLSWEGRRLPNLPTSDEDMPALEAIRWRLAEFEKA